MPRQYGGESLAVTARVIDFGTDASDHRNSRRKIIRDVKLEESAR
jgi:hypothetical protein